MSKCTKELTSESMRWGWFENISVHTYSKFQKSQDFLFLKRKAKNNNNKKIREKKKDNKKIRRER